MFLLIDYKNIEYISDYLFNEKKDKTNKKDKMSKEDKKKEDKMDGGIINGSI